jgi:RAB protein geranylgeranyltransferase component A
VLKNKYNEVEIPQFYYYLTSHYSEMCQSAARILATLGSTYIREQTLSLVKANKSAQESRLTAEHLSSILKITSSQNQ